MTDTLLRDADPAATLDIDPRSSEARRVLLDVLSVPRVEAPRPRRRLRRVLVGGVAVAAVTTVVLTAPLPWDGSSPRYSSAAYAVTAQSDGTVRIVVHWSELRDPAALQAALDKAGARTRILVATVGHSGGPTTPPPACAAYTGGPYSSRAVQWDFPDAASEVNGIVIRPQFFPAGGTFVIEAGYEPGSTVLAQSLSFMAVGVVPTCAVPMTASGSAPPTH